MVYSALPRGPLDLMALPSRSKVHRKAADFVIGLQDGHKAVADNLSQSNTKYKQGTD